MRITFHAGFTKISLSLIRDDVKLAHLVRARDCRSRGRRFDSGNNSKKIDNSNLHGFEVYRPSSKDTKLLFQVIKSNHQWTPARASGGKDEPSTTDRYRAEILDGYRDQQILRLQLPRHSHHG